MIDDFISDLTTLPQIKIYKCYIILKIAIGLSKESV